MVVYDYQHRLIVFIHRKETQQRLQSIRNQPLGTDHAVAVAVAVEAEIEETFEAFLETMRGQHLPCTDRIHLG